MKEKEYIMQEMKNKAKAEKLKELIKMMGKQFLGEFEEHEKDESKTDKKVMKEGVEKKPVSGEIEIEIESEPDEKGEDMARYDDMDKKMAEMFKKHKKESVEGLEGADGGGEIENAGEDEEYEDDQLKRMKMKQKLVSMGMSEEDADDFMEQRAGMMTKNKAPAVKSSKFMAMNSNGMGKESSMAEDSIMKKLGKKMKTKEMG